MKKMSKEWFVPLRVARMNSKLYFPAPDVVSLDLGIRESDSFIHENIPNTKTVYCFGGSTTFGHGVLHKDTWPKQLNLENYTAFNCGSVKSDLKANLHMLLDLLRLGHRPNIVIFYDGVNENTGYTIWDSSIPKYVDYDVQFFSIREIVFKYRVLKFRLNSLIYSIIGQSILQTLYFLLKEKQLKNNSFFSIFSLKVRNFFTNSSIESNFISSAAISYTNTKKLIELILSNFGVEKTLFFLQPTIWNTPQNPVSSPRREYLKDIYSEISRLNPDVIDISEICGNLLKVDMFFDWNHHDERGHKIVAKIIEKFIFDKIV
jgi:hypothetical protein